MLQAQQGRVSVFDLKRRGKLMKAIQEFALPINNLKELLLVMDTRLDRSTLNKLIALLPAPHEKVALMSIIGPVSSMASTDVYLRELVLIPSIEMR